MKILNKNVLIGFFKDKLTMTILFFFNSFLLILFFNLLNSKKLEILYPISISIFLYVILIFLEFFKYYTYVINLELTIKNPYYKLPFHTYIQEETSKTIQSIHENYLKQITSIKKKKEEEKHFISLWIHNIKGDLNVISLLIEKSIICQTSTTNIKNKIEKIYCSIDNVLNMFRLNEFSKDYIPQKVNLIECLKNVISQKSDELIYNKLYPQFHFNFETLYILSDKKWNEFLISQLISNAIKYSKVNNQSKYIHFIIERNNKNISLTIKDEGIGIPSWDLNRVFDAFFTGENGRNYRTATGIGLYLCRNVCKNLGHKISISSEVSIGTSVTISYLAKT